MQDKFLKIYNTQKEFTDSFLKYRKTSIDDLRNNRELLLQYNKEYVLATIKEASDILDKLDWKMHIHSDEVSVRDNILEECIDVIKYTLGIAIINGFSSKEIYEKFINKSKVVKAKFEQEKKLENIYADSNKKIAFLDIDGILAEWPDAFLNLIQKKTKTKFSSIDDVEVALGKKVLVDLKTEYRLSGIKRKLKAIDGSVEFTSRLRTKDYFIILLTARPYKEVFRIYSDTLYWLKKNKFCYDAIIWNENKELFVLQHFMNHNIQFAVDDSVDNAKKLAKNKIKVYLKMKTDNEVVVNKNKYITLFSNFDEIKI
jgi:uncharacterized HAD superfamily protein